MPVTYPGTWYKLTYPIMQVIRQDAEIIRILSKGLYSRKDGNIYKYSDLCIVCPKYKQRATELKEEM